MTRTILRAPVALLLLALGAGLASGAGVKVRAEFDKTFGFRGMRTWTWHPTGPGDVKMAVTPDDKPEAVKARFEPVILDAVQKELEKRRLALAPAGAAPQLYVHYYLLVSTSMSAQTMGQFLPAVPEWGIPPFNAATQSLRVFPQGSLLVDVSAAATNTLVWRGVAEGEIKLDRQPAERDARLRAAIGELLKKFPQTS
jgi:hypothetical protein